MAATNLESRKKVLTEITVTMGKAQKSIDDAEKQLKALKPGPNSLTEQNRLNQKIKNLKSELEVTHPQTYDVAYTRWLLAHPSFPGGKLPSLPMEVKDAIATYLLTRRIKQIEDRVRSKPEVKAKMK